MQGLSIERSYSGSDLQHKRKQFKIALLDVEYNECQKKQIRDRRRLGKEGNALKSRPAKKSQKWRISKELAGFTLCSYECKEKGYGLRNMEKGRCAKTLRSLSR